MRLNTQIGTALILACTNATVHAGFYVDTSRHIVFVANSGELEFMFLDYIGHIEYTQGVDMNHPNSRAAIKVTNDSLVEDDTYKNTSIYHVHNGDINPGQIDSFANSAINTNFTIDQPTTIQIFSEITGFYQPFRDTYSLILENTRDNSTILNLEAPPPNSTIELHLDPGTYNLVEYHEMTAMNTPRPRIRSFEVFTSVSVVPSPATLATLTPLAIAATRRKR
ncbi:MAG: hypothetical protein ACX94C_14265 [Phycisphaerales bacterium]